jgi:hypothetical protein
MRYVGQVVNLRPISIGLGGLGTLFGWRVDNPPQADSLPHKARDIAVTGKTIFSLRTRHIAQSKTYSFLDAAGGGWDSLEGGTMPLSRM